MSDTPLHSVSVAGVVVNDEGKVLVIRRRDNGHWEPPGGVLELDETFEQGVRREVRWMTTDEVCEAMTPAYAVRVTDAFAEGITTRAHDGAHIVDGC